jgi:hypothetical protein
LNQRDQSIAEFACGRAVQTAMGLEDGDIIDYAFHQLHVGAPIVILFFTNNQNKARAQPASARRLDQISCKRKRCSTFLGTPNAFCCSTARFHCPFTERGCSKWMQAS